MSRGWYDIVSTGQRQPIPLAKPERRLPETGGTHRGHLAMKMLEPTWVDGHPESAPWRRVG
ncbi:hypothetical protein GCM10028775_49340 [Catellatospora paridis]